MMDKLLATILPTISKPARYTGGEWNSITKKWPADLDNPAILRLLLAFPDVYEIGMANLALQILYGLLNKDTAIICERTFAPWPDLESALRQHHLPLFSLENRRPLTDFHAIGFSLGYELCYTNVLNMLDLAGLAVKRQKRPSSAPLIFGGGHATVNPAPILDFFDFLVIGEAEEVLLEISDLLKSAWLPVAKSPEAKQNLLLALSAIEGVFVPEYPKTTKRRIVQDLDSCFFPTKPIVPFLAPVHDRASLEIMRGCPNRCRFCQAGYITRPRRERSAALLLQLAQDLLRNTGYEELGLLSLSSGDYTQLDKLLPPLASLCQKKQVALALPSLHIETLPPVLMRLWQETGRSSITLAPEAGTERLRQLVGKNLTDEDILRTVKLAKEQGHKSVKLYFMIGLPSETDDDVRAIADLAIACRQEIAITASVSNFVPKTHTPLQWVEQINISEIRRRRELISSVLKKKQIKFRTHDERLSVLEGIISRGGPECGEIIYQAWKKGCTFDSWSEHFQWDKWLSALGKVSEADHAEELIAPFLRARKQDEDLPWDMIDSGTAKKRLINDAGLEPQEQL